MDDRARVEQLLGRRPRGPFEVVVRDRGGDPVVVRNAPFLDDGTPMPTRYYLVGADIVPAVSRIEADGGVRRAEREIDDALIAATHERYAAERDRAIPADHDGPRPTGGVGGTRRGVKCLHAHLAHHLATGDDPVGRWTLDRLPAEITAAIDPAALAGSPPDGEHAPGTLTVAVADRTVELTMQGGGSWSLPVGVRTLLDDVLTTDPPPPADLTNALGLVADHLEDVLIESPVVAAAPGVVVAGEHATMLARVELGTDDVPGDYRLERADADEVFRTIVVEPRGERVHNPGLDPDHVDTIVATCCVVLAVMRRLDLLDVAIAVPVSAGGRPAADGER